MRFCTVFCLFASGCVTSAQPKTTPPPAAPPYVNAPFSSCVVNGDEASQALVQRDVRIAAPTIEACPGYVVVPQRLFYPGSEVQEVDRLASFTSTDCFYKAPEYRSGDIDCKLAPQQSPAVAPKN